jgi:hypothetical protein
LHVRGKEHFVMAEKESQTFAHHRRWDPLFHFFALPVFLFGAMAAAAYFIRHPGVHAGLMFVVGVAAAIVVFKVRFYSLKVQDRVIRLEERLRLVTLLSEPMKSRIPELTVGQLVALRFASDAEVPRLAERAIAEKLSPADIKKAIQTWRPDYLRI